MARRTAKQRKKEKKIALALVGLLLAAMLAAGMAAFPAFGLWLYDVLGITRQMVPVPGGSDVPVAVHVIDVGQGDAVLLEADGAFSLVDAGPPEGADELAAYLRAVGVKRLEYLVMTHPHADHYGGMERVLNEVEVGLLVLPRLDLAPLPTAGPFEKLLQTALEQQVATRQAATNDVYPLGEGFLAVLDTGLATEDNYNLLSLTIAFEAAGMRFVNSGDAEKANERAMLEAGIHLRADVFLAGHHGSISTSNTQVFIQAVRPGLVVISCGAGNSYGHPHKGALQNFEEVGALVLRTDRDGNVVIKPDGHGGLVYASSRGEHQPAA